MSGAAATGGAVTTITCDATVSTLINVFTVDPANQQRLADLLVQATEQVMRHLAGFVSANIHVSDDGTRVTNYAQWASPAAFQAMLRDPQAREHMGRAAQMSLSVDPHLYRVASTHHATPAG